MKLGILSDIHGNAQAFRAVLNVLLPRVDRILFLGDMAGYYPFVNECMELWDEEKMTGVRGNHDEVLLDCMKRGVEPPQAYRDKYGSALGRSLSVLSKKSRRVIASWPVERSLEISSKRLRLFHGAPWDALNGRVYPDFAEWAKFEGVSADFIILGHTHYPFARRAGKTWIINPGSVGQPRDGVKDASHAELDLGTGETTFRRTPYDASPLIEDARRHDPQIDYLTRVLTQ